VTVEVTVAAIAGAVAAATAATAGVEAATAAMTAGVAAVEVAVTAGVAAATAAAEVSAGAAEGVTSEAIDGAVRPPLLPAAAVTLVATGDHPPCASNFTCRHFVTLAGACAARMCVPVLAGSFTCAATHAVLTRHAPFHVSWGGGGGGRRGNSAREDAEIERLFESTKNASGINFDKYDEIPVEVQTCPWTILPTHTACAHLLSHCVSHDVLTPMPYASNGAECACPCAKIGFG